MLYQTEVRGALLSVAHLRTNATLLEKTDHELGRLFFTQYSAQEAGELGNELSAEEIDRAKVHDEASDVLILLQSALNSSGHLSELNKSIENIPDYPVFPLKSNTIERLEELILDTLDNPSALREVLVHVLSILNHFPHGISLRDGMRKTIEKVLDNRPPELYSVTCPIKGISLTAEDAMDKYRYLEKATRMIRNKCGNRMQPKHWKPIARLLHDFYNAEYNLRNLDIALAMIGCEEFTRTGWPSHTDEKYADIWRVLNGIIAETNGVLRYVQ